MNSTYEPLVTQVGVVPASERGSSECGRIEREDCQNLTEQRDETLGDSRFPVPLYVIAAAALLG